MGEDIRQRDLSGKSLEEMSRQERRELKRRFEVFAKARQKAATTPDAAWREAGSRPVTQWAPRRLTRRGERA